MNIIAIILGILGTMLAYFLLGVGLRLFRGMGGYKNFRFTLLTLSFFVFSAPLLAISLVTISLGIVVL